MSLSRLSPRGVTLIESMVAMLVFTIGIIGIMQMNVLASQQNNLARSRTVASKIARDVADALEPLPANHPLLTQPTAMAVDAPGFASMDIADGLVRLEDVPTLLNPMSRPLIGAADAVYASEGDNNFYEVAWRVWRIPNPERVARGDADPVDQLRILVMVRIPTFQNNTVMVTAWAVKAIGN
ncbi:MAG TPA: prepilin-type N-terminal cleavage/methylation domain-containing protein [Hyalangium sp.]|nr:prepilin-type N-terminal cleavage/methylation domain-containing protein [Hyalangium sp.]